MPHRDRRIQEIAYLLWEQEGRPEGQSDRFWHLAIERYEAEVAAPGETEAEPPALLMTDEPPALEAETPASTKKRASAKAKAAAGEDEKPAAKAKTAKVKDESPKAEKPKAIESEPLLKSADKPKAAKRKPAL